ncbi:MFS transporter [Halorubrum gandharaense]
MTSPIERARTGFTTLRSDPRTPILIVVALGWFLSLGVRLVYPAVIPHLREAEGIGLGTAGLLLSTLWLAYALGQLPGGVLADRFGERAVLVVSTFVSGAMLGLVVASGSVTLLFAATALFGLSTALYGVSRFTILSNVYPENDGTAIGVTMAAGDLGNALLPPLAGFLAVTLTWQVGLGFAIPLFVIAGVGILVWVPSPDADDESSAEGDAAVDGRSSPDVSPLSRVTSSARDVAMSLRRRPVLLVTAIQTLGYCAWQAFTGFYPTYLIDEKGFSATAATLLFGGFFAMGVLVKPMAGRAYDAAGIRRTLPVILLTATAALAALPFVDSVGGLVALTLFLSSLLGYATVTLTYLTDSLPADVQGSGLGALRTGYMVIGAGSPIVAGALAEANYFDEVFLLLAGLVAAGAACCVLLPRQPERAHTD